MSQTITISSKDGDFSAYLARPALIPAPAIIVIQEIFGINADMRKTCDDLADRGYFAICPDLYWRQEPNVSLTDKSDAEWQKALALYKAFDVEAGIRDIADTLAAIRREPGASGQVGAVGYCLGGLLAYLTAARTDINAVSAYYGVGIDKYLDEAKNIRHALLMHIAEADEFVPKATWQHIAAVLKEHPQVEIHTYPGCSHAFARHEGVHYDEASARRANQRTAKFFRENLEQPAD
ncbi:dienelactone hydrolase family protein [Undibacterium sp. TJN25]|uniref:dienelactone hydrolase family protein n=1 Tax=Undibacterium sp. TJN25 TaxID=3413056 RepID=UPI003BF3BDAE